MRCDLATAAHGVLTVCNEAMAEAIRLMTVRRGIDPRGFALVLLGGAGPVHGGAVARALGIGTVIVPARPGVLAAEGLLYARIEQDAQRSFLRPAMPDSAGPLVDICHALERECRAGLADAEPRHLPVATRFAADMRYIGQSYEIEVPLALDTPDPSAAVLAEFHRRYRDLHGHGSLTEMVEFVNLRCVASCQPAAPEPAVPVNGGEARPHAARPVCFDRRLGFREVPVYFRSDLGAGARLVGPAVIEQPDTTTIVHPGQTCRAGECGSLIINWN